MKSNWTLKIIILAILNLSLSLHLWSCSCGYSPYFCINASPGYFIALVEVDKEISFEEIEVRVLENLHQEIAEDTIRVFGQDGINCLENLGKFELGDQLILALYSGTNGYELSGLCGLHFLRLEGGIVKGSIYPNLNSLAYQDFKDGLLDCLDSTTALEEAEEVATALSLFPNPVKNDLNIVSEEVGIDEIQLFSIKGELLIHEQGAKNANRTIDLGALGEGIYFLKVRRKNEITVRKIIKE